MRAYHASVGTGIFRFNIVSGAFGEGVRFGDYGSGSVASTDIIGNTFVGNTTALDLLATQLPAVLSHNVCKTSGTSVSTNATENGLLTKSCNVLDPTVSASFTADATDTTGVDAAIDSTTFIPAASGNCDATGNPALVDWVGDCDPFGWVLIYASSLMPRGARSRPGVYAGADLQPDLWA